MIPPTIEALEHETTPMLMNLQRIANNRANAAQAKYRESFRGRDYGTAEIWRQKFETYDDDVTRISRVLLSREIARGALVRASEELAKRARRVTR